MSNALWNLLLNSIAFSYWLITFLHPMLKVLFQMFGKQNTVNRYFYHCAKEGGIFFLFPSQWNRFWARQQAWQYMSGMRWDKTRGARALGQPALPCWDTNTALACSPALFKHTNYSCKLVTTSTTLYVCAFVVGVTAVLLCVCKSLCVEISWRNQFTLPFKIFFSKTFLMLIKAAFIFFL